MKEEVFTHNSLEIRDTTYHAEPHGKASGSGRSRKSDGKAWIKSLRWFSWEGMGKTGEQADQIGIGQFG